MSRHVSFRLLNLKFKLRIDSSLNIKRFKSAQVTVVSKENVSTKNNSTLFVPGREGAMMYQIVKPSINVNEIVNNITKIRQTIDLRGIQLDIESFIDDMMQWETTRNKFEMYVEKEQECRPELLRLKESDCIEEYSSLQSKYNQIVDELKALKVKIYDLDDILMPVFKGIPNYLDLVTPLEHNISHIIKKNDEFDFDVLSHVDIGTQMSCLEFSDVSPSAYYLSGMVSELEIALQHYFSDYFSSLSYVPFSCVDFAKSFIIEAIGLDPYSNNDCIPIKPKFNDKGQKLNLVGGASLEAFCAYLANMNFDKTMLPMKYFSLGRRFNAKHRTGITKSLFSVVQSTNIHCLVLYNPSSETSKFRETFETILQCYSQLEIPCRTTDVSARNLNPVESRRKQIELWSPALKEYIPCAHVSQYDDFISKRLQITYGIEHKIDGYCGIIDSVALNSQMVLACIMENFQIPDKTFNIPHVLKEYIF